LNLKLNTEQPNSNFARGELVYST